MQQKWWPWVLISSALGFWLGPYLLGTIFGGLYAWFAIPIYSQVCRHHTLAFMDSPDSFSAEDYQMFLLGKGCSAQEVRDKEDKQQEALEGACGRPPDPICASVWRIGHTYRPVPPSFNDDLIGNLFSHFWTLFVDHFWETFIPTTLGAAERLGALVQENA
jgi:hypothetical protein